MYSCKSKTGNADPEPGQRIIFLHHSTGNNIWQGDQSGLKSKFRRSSAVETWFKGYNKTHGSNYMIKEMTFPQAEPYGWKNYPYDYYNIWVKNVGNHPAGVIIPNYQCYNAK